MAGTPGKTGQGQQDLHDFMKTLDELSASTPGTAAPGSASTSSPAVSAPTGGVATSSPEDAQSVLDFLDEITQRSSTPIAPVPTARKVPSQPNISRQSSKGNVRSTTPGGSAVGVRKSTDSSGSAKAAAPSSEKETASPPASPPANGGWGWSSMWNSASSVIQQARNVAEENMKHLPQGTPQPGDLGEQAKKWRVGVMDLVKKGVDVEKLKNDLRDTGMRTFTDLINAVAPPIAEHEVIQVWLSHDMQGYDGVEDLVYRAMAKIMEQVEGGDLVVNRGNEEKPSANANAIDDDRNLNTVEGLEEAYKLAEANLDALVKQNFKPRPDDEPTEKADPAHPPHGRTTSTASALAPITYCPIYMRIQPCLAPLPFFSTPSPSHPDASPAPDTTVAALTAAEADKQLQLFFLLLLRDPTHNIVHRTLTQAMPSPWLDIPFEENEWVEDNMVDMIRKGVETVGQAYVISRHATMGTRSAPTATDAPRSPAIAPTDDPTVAAASAAAS